MRSSRSSCHAVSVNPPSEGTLVWILREYPFGETSGQSQWFRSLLASSTSAGFQNHVYVPTGANLPVMVKASSAAVSVRSPHLRLLGRRLSVSTPATATKRLMWLAYKGAPQRLQVFVANQRRSRRSKAAADHVLGREWSPEESRWIQDELARTRPDVVIFDSPFTLTPVPEPARRALLLTDLVHERAASLAGFGYRTTPAGVTRDWEAERLKAVDAVAAIQWDEARTARDMAPDARVIVAPPSFRRMPPGAGSAVAYRCLFVGSGSLHNVDGVRWMLDEIWGLIRERVPGAELRIVGTVASQVKATAPGVDLVGEVADLTREYHQAALVMVPLRVGSGLKLKIVEAICHGRASVSTIVGAQGLSDLAPRPFVVADGASEFVDAAVELLLDDSARRLLEEAAMEASRSFEPAAAHQDFLEVLSSLSRN